MIKILFAASKYDYCDPKLGLSNEYYFFYDTLKHMDGVEVILFDWVTLTGKFGKAKMNDLLYQKVRKNQPDLVLFSIFGEEFEKDIIKKLSTIPGVTTINIFANDSWQYESFSKYWAPSFTWIATDEHSCIAKYKKDIDYANVLPWHWGINPRHWKNTNQPSKYDVSFVGQAYGNRKGIIRGIQQKGVNIEPFGRGFTNGKVTFAEMITIFNTSKINLNISLDSRYMEYAKFLPELIQPKTINLNHFQMKARVFEVPGCGGFLLTTYGEALKEYFKLGQEIETYKDFDEMIEKIKFYLKNESIRTKIAKAGYRKTLNKYTYQQILSNTFNSMGLYTST